MKYFLSTKFRILFVLFIISKLCFCKDAQEEVLEPITAQKTEIKTLATPVQVKKIPTKEKTITKIPSQLQDVGAKLQILNAEYGILDNQIRSSENIALKNKRTQCFLEVDKNLWIYTRNKLDDFKEHYIFQIEKLDGKPGEIIKAGDTVVFKTIVPFDGATYYLGVNKRAGWAMGKGAKKMYFAYLVTKKTDSAAHWIIDGNVTEGGEITLKSIVSEKYIFDTKFAEQRAVVEGDTKQIGDSDLFIIHRVLPPNKGNIFPTYVPYIVRQIKKTNIVEYLNGIINTPNKIITNMNGGITVEDTFSDSFGDLDLTHDNSNIFKQLKVTYQLDRTIYTHIYTDGEIVQIPTLEELIKAKQDVATRDTIKKDLGEIGFFKIEGRLIKISSNSGLTFGLNADNNLFSWNEKAQRFEQIKTQMQKAPLPDSPEIVSSEIKLKDIAVGNDGTILAISKNNQVLQVKLMNGSAILYPILNKQFIDLSIENKNIIWLIDTKGNVFTTDLETKELKQVGTKTFSHLSAGTGQAWGLTPQGDLYRWMGGKNYQDDKNWIKISNQKFKQISIGKDIWAIGEYKAFEWNSNNNQFEEEALAKHIGYITISNTGDIWSLVPENPNLPAGDAIYRKAKMLLTLNHPIALQGSNNLYLSVGPEGFVSSSTSWPESFVFANPENPTSLEVFRYQQKLIIKSLATNLYIKTIKDDEENISVTALETNPKNATIFKVINQLNKKDSSEIERGKKTLIFLETLDGLQLGTSRSDGGLYLDSNVGGFDKKWQIEDAAE